VYGSESDDPMWRGILYSVLILLFATVQTVFLSQYFYRMYIVGMWSKSALISAIYRSFKINLPGGRGLICL
jgi:ATP-binding cassette subfamily C (CFTR/MRP) protein 1